MTVPTTWFRYPRLGQRLTAVVSVVAAAGLAGCASAHQDSSDNGGHDARLLGAWNVQLAQCPGQAPVRTDSQSVAAVVFKPDGHLLRYDGSTLIRSLYTPKNGKLSVRSLTGGAGGGLIPGSEADFRVSEVMSEFEDTPAEPYSVNANRLTIKLPSCTVTLSRSQVTPSLMPAPTVPPVTRSTSPGG